MTQSTPPRPAGRPRVLPVDQKGITVRLAPADWALMRQAAAAQGVSLSQWARTHLQASLAFYAAARPTAQTRPSKVSAG